MKEASAPSVMFTEELSELITRLVKQILYEYRRQAMGDVVQTLLEGKSRKAEDVLGWNRHTVELGINEFRTGIRWIETVEQKWFNSVTDLVTERNRLKSRLRLVQHGIDLANGSAQALPPPIQPDVDLYARTRYHYHDVNII